MAGNLNPDSESPIESELIVAYRQIHPDNSVCLNSIIEQAVAEKLGIILLTSDAWRKSDFKTLLRNYQAVPHVIHIALISDQDLAGIFDNEWVLWGYNETTGLLLKTLLESFMDPIHE